MSMLAERKRKQKWSLNPRGNDWVQDSNKFGLKMLEKMGWQNGKGLGAKEDGITEHIKVSYKNDSRGMGFKESNDQWTEHETNFSALLESLSGEKTEEIKLNSLKKKSQNSRARVHYHKFTRGKDLSNYSEKDLANIFGKKSLKDSRKVAMKDEKSETTEEKNENESKFLFNAGSMRDYFKKKLPGFGKSNGYVVGHNGVLRKEESESESDMRPSFAFNPNEDSGETSYAGFGFKSETTADKSPDIESKSTFVSYVNGNCDEDLKEKKSKKKRKAEDVVNVSSPKKKPKKNKEVVSTISADESNESRGISNPAFNPLHTPVKVQKHMLHTIEESISEDNSEPEDDSSKFGVTTVQVHEGPQKKKKRSVENSCGSTEGEECIPGSSKTKKKSIVSENGFANGVFVEIDTVDLSLNGDKEDEVIMTAFEVKRKEKKKKKQQQKPTQNGAEIETIDNIDLANNSGGINLSTLTDFSKDQVLPDEQIKKSKKKKRVDQSVDLTEESADVSVIEEVPPKLNNKKKNKEKNLALENPGFDSVLEDSVNVTEVKENPYEVKVKKKKKKTKAGIDNLNFNGALDECTNISQNEENPYEVKVNQKKKKNKRNDYAVENPNFNESLEEEVVIHTEVIENPYEVKPKKKRKKKNDPLAIDNPNFDPNDSTEAGLENNAFEVKRKEKNSKDVEYKVQTSEVKENVSIDIEETDLMLNIVTTPIVARTEPSNDGSYSVARVNSVKRRKSVRFSDVTQEMIIPNNDDLRNLSDIEIRNELFEINTQVIKRNLQEQNISFDMSTLDKVNYDDNSKEKRGQKRELGVDNAAFDKQKADLEENLDSISKTIERYQAEIENDINEKKLETLSMDDIMIGDVGNPDGEHEKLPEGTKLKFKYANFLAKTPFYHLDKVGSKKAYKHLIKGDITVGFKNTNLHEIHGYASKSKSTVV